MATSLIERPPLPDGDWLVCGLARSGQAAARVLSEKGFPVRAVDSASPEGAAGLAEWGVEVHLDAAGDDLVTASTILVKSPGVPKEAPVVRAAKELDAKVLGELELGWRLTDGQVTAVTGTNGKTTVTEMIGHLSRSSGRECAVVGNVGRPICDLVGKPEAHSSIVLEASSFQLEDASAFAPDVAVLLNIGSDHLDRHGTYEDYREAKLSMLDRQPEQAVAIVPGDMVGLEGRGRAQRLTFGKPESDVATIDGELTWHGEPFATVADVRLPGVHNLRNAEAACAAAIASGVPIGSLAEGLRTFQGVPHRLELVAERGGVRWYNDSKATNVDSTLTALAAVQGPVRLILGGQGKGQDLTPLRAAVASQCASVHLIGESAGVLSELLSDSGVHTQIDDDLRLAVAACSRLARSGEAVLLSPACASFDQFSDFEDRGDSFRKLVREL